MPNPKCHTVYALFNGSGAPPSPFTGGFAGGGAAPTQINGTLRFSGVGVGGSDSELELSTPLDLTNDALFLQFQSIIGQPGTVELDLTFSSGWILTLQLRGLNWNVILMHGATVVQNKTETVDRVLVPTSPPSEFAYLIPNNEPLCWCVAYQITNLVTDVGTLEVMWGPTPQQMRTPYVILDLPVSIAQNLNDILLRSVNLETQSITYGETRLIGFNAWAHNSDLPVNTVAGAAHSDGTAFVGQSGHGSLALDPHCVGVRVDITLNPGWYSEAIGDPDKFWDFGWVNFGNGTSWSGPQAIRFEHQNFFPFPQEAPDHLGYSLGPGIEATITCIL